MILVVRRLFFSFVIFFMISLGFLTLCSTANLHEVVIWLFPKVIGVTDKFHRVSTPEINVRNIAGPSCSKG